MTPFNPNDPESHFGDGKKRFGVSWNDRPSELGVISGEGWKKLECAKLAIRVSN